MRELTLRRSLARRTRERDCWKTGALGLLTLSAVVNAAFASALMDTRAFLASVEEQYQVQLQQAERTRDQAVRELRTLALQTAEARQALMEQAAAYEALENYRYIGECTVTAYCPCEQCCGRWADGLTATGIPAGPGVVAVDPDVIPLGSTVVIDGQRYLAADTGVNGLHVDICLPDHRDTIAFGVQTAEVWIETGGIDHG